MRQARAIPGGVARLDRMFKPTSVVIFGASPEVGTARNSIVRVLMQTGFPGDIYLINPRHAEIEGLPCYPDLQSLPAVPDLALIITPGHTVAAIIEACGEAGVGAAIVFSSGFEEMEGGDALARELLETANRSGVAILGPNCIGAWSIADRTILSFGAAARRMRELRHAPIAIVSQSGALGGAMANYLQSNGIGCAYMISVGNETQLDILDALAWTIEQDDVKVALLYVEGVKDGGRIVEIARRALARGVQIAALKSGVSELGRSATASHTGKIASAEAVYSGVFEQAGVISVESLADLFLIGEAFAYLRRPRRSGDPEGGISALSTSGGACALLADYSERFDAPMATFSPETAAALDEIFPAFARSANPADMTGQIRRTPTMLQDSMDLMAADPRTEAFVMQFSSSGRQDVAERAELFMATARDRNLPVIMSYAGEQPDPDQRDAFRAAGVIFTDDPQATMRVLGWMYQHERYRARAETVRRPPENRRAPPTGWGETMALLAECGIGAPRWQVLGPDDAASDRDGLAFPVAVKALPEDAAHKTELGLVRLGVDSASAVDSLARSFRETLGRPDAAVLIQEMADGGVEVALACLRDPDLGPVLSVGLGGVGVELFRDVAYLALPTNAAEVKAAIAKLKLQTLLDGFRGRPPADVDALADAAVRLGDAFLEMADVAEFEINPLMAMPKGDGVLAVDALLSLAPQVEDR